MKANATGNSAGDAATEKDATMRRLGNSIACKTVEKEASMPPARRTPTRMIRNMISFRKLFRHWTPWRRNTLTSRPPWQMSQASTRQEMCYTQRPWKWLQSSNKPRKIKAVNGTIWTARARNWPRQPKNFQAAGQLTRPPALNFAAPSGMFATDVQRMKSFASKQRRRCIEHLKLRYKKAWRHTGSELDVLQMSTPRQ